LLFAGDMSHATRSYRPPLDAEDLSLALLGNGPAVVALRGALSTLGQLEMNLLLCGESGTGKHACAMALHRLSPRRTNPFYTMHLDGMSDARIEECLFGVRGLTSLVARTRLATIYVDGIDSLSRRYQVRLATALAQNESPGVRIIAGTAVSLEEHVRLGRFERALYDRLATVQVSLPPLRERREDIALIAPAAFERWAERTGLPIKIFGDGAMAQLQAYDWPTNVRELLCVLSVVYEHTRGAVISADRVRTELGARPRRHLAAGIVPLKQVERDYLLAVMHRCGGNQTLAARRLGIGRSTLLRHLQSLGYARPEPIDPGERGVERLPLSARPSSGD
jgi:two-component system nitrogen regulation response regulator NtrX